MVEVEEVIQEPSTSTSVPKLKKTPKRGIIYLSTIPPYMNVSKIREYFSEFGTVGRVYLQLSDKITKPKDGKVNKKKIAKKFTEGWVEFEKKFVAKQVAASLNNTQVSNRKKSKQYDYIWNIKYLSGFKWTHLHERLAYEKAARRQKLRAEVQLAKKKSNYFSSNLDKKKKKDFVNKEFEKLNTEKTDNDNDKVESGSGEMVEDRKEFLKSLFS